MTTKINPSEISSIIKKKIDDYKGAATEANVGEVLSTADGIVQIYGLEDAMYGELLDFHKKHHAIGTMAVKVHELQNPFGIVDMEGINIKGFVEKPIYKSYINAGIYVLNRGVLSLLQSDKHCDMPELFLKLKENGKLIIGYPMHEPWRDIGRPDDLKAIRLMTKND